MYTGSIGNPVFEQGGAGGVIQLMEWDGTVTWEYVYSSTTYLQHHDVSMLPNGNILMLVWQYKTKDEALKAGRIPSMIKEGALWVDSVVEVRPTGSNTGEIVWEWHVWDHLVQSFSSDRDNYGIVLTDWLII
ncbi:hypothetical protein KKHLCK_07800 [Candidatus Electrothrix laxa]